MIKYKCFRGEIMKLPNIKILDEKDKLLRTKSKEVIFPLSKEDKKYYIEAYIFFILVN